MIPHDKKKCNKDKCKAQHLNEKEQQYKKPVWSGPTAEVHIKKSYGFYLVAYTTSKEPAR